MGSAIFDYAESVKILQRQDPGLAGEVADFGGVTAVLSWMARRGLSRGPVEIVGMDEFEYDFLIQLEPARWIVFGLT
jgi:hypothetical protein